MLPQIVAVIVCLCSLYNICGATYVVQDSIVFRGVFNVPQNSMEVRSGGSAEIYDVPGFTISHSVLIEERAHILILNRNSFSSIQIGTGQAGSSFINRGFLQIKALNTAASNYYKFHMSSFVNNGEMIIHADGQSSELKVLFNDLTWTNTGRITIKKDTPGVANFEMSDSANDATNNGAMCLRNTNFVENMRIMGSGCVALVDSNMIATSSRVTYQKHNIVMRGKSTYLESAYFAYTDWTFYGFSEGMALGITAPIEGSGSWTYNTGSGDLRLQAGANDLFKYFRIGTGYVTSKFRIVDLGGYRRNALTYDGPAPQVAIPDACSLCEEPVSLPLPEGIVETDEENPDYALVVTAGADGLWTTVNSYIGGKETATVTIEEGGVTRTETQVIQLTIDENRIVTYTSLHTPSSRSYVTTFTTGLPNEETTVTAFVQESTLPDGHWSSMTDSNLWAINTVTTRAVEGGNTKDVEIVMYEFESATVGYETRHLSDPVGTTRTSTVSNEEEFYTELVVVTSNAEQWWFTTTIMVPRSSYTTAQTIDVSGETVIALASALTNEAGSWTTETAYFIPSIQKYLTTYTVTNEIGSELVTSGLYEVGTDDSGNWFRTTHSDLVPTETITTRITTEIQGQPQPKDAQVIGYNYAGVETFSATLLLDDPVAKTETITVDEGEGTYTGIVRVTSDAENWWYTTTDVVPRSSYTSTETIDRDGESATAIFSAFTNNEGSWVTETSFHTPVSQTYLTTITTTDAEGEVVVTGLYDEHTDDRGEWVTSTYTEIVDLTTFTSRVVTEVEGVMQTKDAEMVGLDFEGFGYYYVTSLLDDPVARTETITVDEGEGTYTGIVRVTSDAENWWYTTTDVVPRSSYTSTETIDRDGESATAIFSAFTNNEGSWVTETSFHTPVSQTYLTTITTTDAEGEVVVTGLYDEHTDDRGEWVTSTYTEIVDITTFTSRVVTEVEGVMQTKDAEMVGLDFEGFGYYYVTSLLDDPVARTETITVDEGEGTYTGIVRVTSDAENWWYTTTDVVPRSSYTSTETIDRDGESATAIFSAFTNNEGSWVTETSFHTPVSQTYLTTITTTDAEGEVVVTGLYDEHTDDRGEWVTSTYTEIVDLTTFTSRVVTEVEGVMQTKDAEMVGLDFEGFGYYYVTSLLDDPVARTETITVDEGEGTYTGIVRVTSDAENWWYTTTDVVPRSSYTSTETIDRDGESATAIFSAFTNNEGSWVTETSFHTPVSQTYLTTITTTDAEGEVVVTGLYDEHTDDRGEWVTSTYTEIVDLTTFTSRVVTEVEGVMQTKDAEMVGLDFEGFGYYYVTSLLDDPVARTETITVDEGEGTYTGIVRVTSDAENWWYTTTDVVPRSSYTSTETIDRDGESATAIFSAFTNNEGSWVTETSFHTPVSQTYLTTITTTDAEGEVVVTGLYDEHTDDRGEWVTSTYTEIVDLTTFTSRVVTEVEGVMQTKDAEMVGLDFEGFGYYYVTSLLDDPVARTETITVDEGEGTYTGIVRVTSDAENWWYTTTDVVPRSSYTSTFTLVGEDQLKNTAIVSAQTDEFGAWVTHTSYHIPVSETYLEVSRSIDGAGETVTSTELVEIKTDDRGEWVTSTYTEIVDITTFTSRVVTEVEGVMQTKDAEMVGLDFEGFGYYYVTSLLDDPVARTETITVDEGEGTYTGIVRVTSDAENWWYTTTDVVPRSSYTSTFTLVGEDQLKNTAIVSAQTDEFGAWVTHTSYHIPVSETYLEVSRSIDGAGETVTSTELVEIKTDDRGEWVTSTYTEIVDLTTFTSRVVTEVEGVMQTKDAEMVGLDFEGFGYYYVTSLLDDPVARTETITVDEGEGTYTGIVRVTSDAENWWYTTTDVVPRSSYTSTETIDRDGESATAIFSAFTNNEGSWVTETSFHTPVSQTYLTTITTTDAEGEVVVTGLYDEHTDDRGEWVTSTYTEIVDITTFTSRVVTEVEGVMQTKDAEMVGLDFEGFGYYYVTSLLDDPVARTETITVDEGEGTYTGIVRVTSDAENWWYTTTDVVPRSSYTSTFTLVGEDQLKNTAIVSAQTDEFGAWVTHTSYHIPVSETYLEVSRSIDGAGETVTSTELVEIKTDDRGEWVTSTYTEIVDLTTFTSRVVTEVEGVMQTKDAEMVGLDFEGFGYYYVTSLLDDPVARTETITVDEGEGTYTGIVRVTSDAENWWYTTTDVVPRSSYTSTETIDRDGESATAIFSAFTNNEGSWVTETSFHTPVSQTYLTTITTTDAEGEVVVTGLYDEHTDDRGEWVTSTYTEIVDLTTFTSRVVTEVEGVMQTKDAEMVGLDFEGFGYYYVTSLLDDPVARTETITVDEGEGTYTGIVRVTSDAENWWYTTTDVVPRSSYTSTETIDRDGESATAIFSAFTNNEGSWVTETSFHTPVSQTYLTTITTTDAEGEVVVTGLYDEHTDDRGEWVTSTYTEIVDITTFTSRVVTEVEGVMQTKDAEMVGLDFEGFGYYYVTSLLDDPVARTETITVDEGEGTYTGIVRVTSDAENWWYTTTDVVPRSSYTSTETIDRDGESATAIFSAFTNNEGSWVTETSFHTPVSQTYLTTITTTDAEGEVVVTGLYDEHTDEQGNWVSTVHSTLHEATTFTRRVVTELEGDVTELEGSLQTKDAEIVGYNYDGEGYFYVTSLLDDPVARTETITVDEGEGTYTGIVRVTSDAENWWYTTTDVVPRSSYTSTFTLVGEDQLKNTAIVSAQTDEFGAWVTHTSYHIPVSETYLEVSRSIDGAGETVTSTELVEIKTDDRGEWVTSTYTEIVDITTFTSRVVTEVEGVMQTKDAEMVGLDFEGFGYYYVTSLLDDPVARTETITVDEGEGTYTGIVRVTSDAENWWYTTTDVVPRSSYTSTETIDRDGESATAIFSAFTNNEGSWVTETSFHTPVSQTYLTTITTTDAEGEVVVTGLYDEHTDDRGEWVTSTYTEIVDITTFTSRVVTEVEGVMQTKDAEMVGLDFEGFGYYYVTSLLDDPVARTETITVDEGEGTYTGIVRVTSDAENWWYTTTDVVPRSSYTSTETIDRDGESATAIFSAFTNNEGSWVTETSFHTPVSQTYLTTITTTDAEGEVVVTGLYDEHTDDRGEWVTSTYTEIVDITTFTSRVVTEVEGVMQTKDAEMVGLDFEGFGYYYVTSLLDDPVARTETITVDEGEGTYTGIVRVTSDAENWWYTTTDMVAMSSSDTTLDLHDEGLVTSEQVALVATSDSDSYESEQAGSFFTSNGDGDEYALQTSMGNPSGVSSSEISQSDPSWESIYEIESVEAPFLVASEVTSNPQVVDISEMLVSSSTLGPSDINPSETTDQAVSMAISTSSATEIGGLDETNEDNATSTSDTSVYTSIAPGVATRPGDKSFSTDEISEASIQQLETVELIVTTTAGAMTNTEKENTSSEEILEIEKDSSVVVATGAENSASGLSTGVTKAENTGQAVQVKTEVVTATVVDERTEYLASVVVNTAQTLQGASAVAEEVTIGALTASAVTVVRSVTENIVQIAEQRTEYRTVSVVVEGAASSVDQAQSTTVGPQSAGTSGPLPSDAALGQVTITASVSTTVTATVVGGAGRVTAPENGGDNVVNSADNGSINIQSDQPQPLSVGEAPNEDINLSLQNADDTQIQNSDSVPLTQNDANQETNASGVPVEENGEMLLEVEDQAPAPAPAQSEKENEKVLPDPYGNDADSALETTSSSSTSTMAAVNQTNGVGSSRGYSFSLKLALLLMMI
ncbi:uncharacterized protein LODBEIA_P49920 [Lodderomyces beijingensis]|uniref:Hyphally-regulated cell wall protein N-terminal domain-containing protein n=1 Tax=Lodderomyces beijingensis TaxID=1775926 RepID=A0ABP0ZRI1_9ASCO